MMRIWSSSMISSTRSAIKWRRGRPKKASPRPLRRLIRGEGRRVHSIFGLYHHIKKSFKGSGRASRFGGRLWLSSSAIAAAAGFLRQFQAEADCMEQAADGMKVPSTSPNSRNSSAKRIKTRKRQAVGKGGKFKTSKCVNISQQY